MADLPPDQSRPTNPGVPTATPVAQPDAKKSEDRSIFKTIISLGRAMFWVMWDWFWAQFDLQPVGDEVKEHAALMRKRAKVIVIIFVCMCMAGCGVWKIQEYFQGIADTELKGKLVEANETIRQLREFNAGRPSTKSPAELMGFHDETNFIVVTNTMITTNPVPQFFSVTNVMVESVTNTVNTTNVTTIYDNPPPLGLSQIAAIVAKLNSAPHFPITVYYLYNDNDSIALAKEVAWIFKLSGFQVNIMGPVSGIVRENAITVFSRKAPSSAMQNALTLLSDDLGQQVKWVVDASRENPEISIYVRSINK